MEKTKKSIFVKFLCPIHTTFCNAILQFNIAMHFCIICAYIRGWGYEWVHFDTEAESIPGKGASFHETIFSLSLWMWKNSISWQNLKASWMFVGMVRAYLSEAHDISVVRLLQILFGNKHCSLFLYHCKCEIITVLKPWIKETLYKENVKHNWLHNIFWSLLTYFW